MKLNTIIPNNVQDRQSEAWLRLCDYVEKVAEEGSEEFSPREYLGKELFSQIHTLPESISKLKKVKKVMLYGSKLKRIPPEIGEMESLESFVPYTSYDLNWFPYEITYCKELFDSTVSTRALYGNFKYWPEFPDLRQNPVRYFGEKLHCSVCRKPISYAETNQLWITLWVGTDFLPLLTNLCSKACEEQLPKPSRIFVPHPHKGGPDLEQPNPDRCEFQKLWREQMDARALKRKKKKPRTPKDDPIWRICDN